MQGFEDRFRDLPDYIYKITREIWEERGIGGSLEKYYAQDIIVRATTGITTSNAGVAAATLATLHEFPDRQLIYEDVIWSGNEDDGFLSSHRLISVMRKQHDGAHGPASGVTRRGRGDDSRPASPSRGFFQSHPGTPYHAFRNEHRSGHCRSAASARRGRSWDAPCPASEH